MIWKGFELHPDTPPGGEPLTNRFTEDDIEYAFETLRQRGREFGIVFGDLRHISNSRLALEVSELARERGLYHRLHDELFRAYFTDLRDIGDEAVLLDVASAVGLDPDEVRRVLRDRPYRERLDALRVEGEELDVAALPTFFIRGEDDPRGAIAERIIGAVETERFRETLWRVANPATPSP